MLAGVLAGACTSTSAPIPVGYRRAANAVCRSTRAKVAQFPKPDTTDPSSLVASGRRTLAAERDAVRDLSALAPTPRDERLVRRWLALTRRALGAVDASLRAQARGDLTAAARANADGATRVTAADEVARRLKLSECATPISG